MDIGKDEVALGIDEFEDVGEGVFLATEVDAAQGDGNYLCAAGLQSAAHGLRGRKLSGSEEQTGVKRTTGDEQRFRHVDSILSKPWMRCKAGARKGGAFFCRPMARVGSGFS